MDIIEWLLWDICWLLLDDGVRLSRIIAVAAGITAVGFLIYGFVAPDSLWQGIALAIFFLTAAIVAWKLGNWWQLRQLIRKAQAGMPERRRGFELVRKKR